ncbi:hypothetical protein LENED_012803 [Lentinula edodes]|uniref:Uncharacterized protein n=1 Tax=Lentinula edodes TaxID=5353 RepID=A0A1Q3ETU6_LENED|nr:hypothetical protein LENED_012803 [Lentinula edodes]
MFKRIERKRKRQEEEEALGLDEEVKEALGMGGVDSDSEESDDEESGSEENGDENEESEEVEEEEEGDSSDVGEEETEDVDMKIKDDSESEEEKPPTISKRALKKQARQQKIQKIRERHAIWKKEKLQVASKVSSTLKTTPSTTPRRQQRTVTTTTTTSSKSSPTIKDPVAASRVDAVDSAQNNNTGGLEKENGARPKSQTQSKSKSKPDAAVTHVKGKAALKSPSLSSAGKSVAGDADVRAEGKKKQAATRTSKLNDAIVKKKKKKNNGKRDIVLSNEGDINGYEREGAIAKFKPQKSSPTRTNTTVASAIPPKPKKPKHRNTAKDIDMKLLKNVK